MGTSNRLGLRMTILEGKSSRLRDFRLEKIKRLKDFLGCFTNKRGYRLLPARRSLRFASSRASLWAEIL